MKKLSGMVMFIIHRRKITIAQSKLIKKLINELKITKVFTVEMC